MGKKLMTFFFAVVFIAVVGIYFMPSFGGENNLIIQQSLYLLPPFIAAIVGLAAFFLGKNKGKFRYAILFVGIGVAFWAIAELCYVIFTVFLEVEAFPSAADYFYVSAYIFFIIGFLLTQKSIKSKFKWRLKSSVGALIFGLSQIGYIFYEYLKHHPESFLTNVLAVFYVLGDLFLAYLIFLVILAILEAQENYGFYSWLYLFLGMFIVCVADVLFLLFETEYSESVGFIYSIDLLWAASYLFFAQGFLAMCPRPPKLKT